MMTLLEKIRLLVNYLKKKKNYVSAQYSDLHCASRRFKLRRGGGEATGTRVARKVTHRTYA